MANSKDWRSDRYKGNLPPPPLFTHTHTVNVIELHCKAIEKWQPPISTPSLPVQVYPPFLAKIFVPPPKWLNFWKVVSPVCGIIFCKIYFQHFYTGILNKAVLHFIVKISLTEFNIIMVKKNGDGVNNTLVQLVYNTLPFYFINSLITVNFSSSIFPFGTS